MNCTNATVSHETKYLVFGRSSTIMHHDGYIDHRSRLGCQVKLTPELDGMTATLPAATRNMFVDGERPILLSDDQAVIVNFIQCGMHRPSLDIYSPTGFHTYISCLQGQSPQSIDSQNLRFGSSGHRPRHVIAG